MKTQVISHSLNLSILILATLFFCKTNTTTALAQQHIKFAKLSSSSTPDITAKTNLNNIVYTKTHSLSIDFFSKKNSEKDSVKVDKTKNTIVILNDKEVNLSPVPRGNNKVRKMLDVISDFTWSLDLREGINKIRIGALTNTRHLDTTIAITYVNPARTPALHLLLVGNDYKSQNNINNLIYTQNSMKNIEKAFQKKSGYQSISIKDLVNEEATKANIEQAIEELSDEASENDIVVVYFATHANGEAIVLAESTHIEDTNPEKTISKDDLKNFMEELPCKTLLLLDVCNSSQLMPNTNLVYNESIAVEGHEKHNPTDYLMKYPSAKMTIAAGRNSAYEIHDLKNSIFATAFKSMFQYKAGDHNKDGYIDFGEMKRYLKKEMAKLGKRHKVEQKPNFSPYESSDIDHIPISEIKK